MRKLTLLLVAIAATVALSATAAFAAATFNPATGEGFVGKGDVQTAFNLNNKQLQEQAQNVSFSFVSVTEQTWVCTNTNNENTQERARTTESQGLFEKVTRDNKKQVTGFLLTGFDTETAPTTSTEGPPLNSCPSGPWTLTQPAGDPVLVPELSGLFATLNGVTVQIPLS
jgi:opacity protein-like surface antigen